jgi:hypothetical protein
MQTKERVQLRECCLVPYRVAAFGVEFCLVTPVSQNRWEFPKISLDAQSASCSASLDQLAAGVGLNGHIHAREALGHFIARRGNEERSMTGYLMQVTEILEAWPERATQKRLWCLAEEGRVRIRRKPLRQFIDLALHAVEARSRLLNGNGNGSARKHG